MELLQNGISLETSGGAFPLSTDSMLLAFFARLPKNARVLDLGSGCGTLGLLLCAKDPACQVTGVEIDPAAHEAALENIRRNNLSSRLSSICADMAAIASLAAPGFFHCCVSNPPYFAGGPASKETPIARREDCCTMQTLFAAADTALKFGGDFFLVHRPERLAELIACAATRHLEAKRLLLVRHREGSPISLVLLAFRKGGKPGLQIEEASLFDAGGQPTQFYKEVYHL